MAKHLPNIGKPVPEMTDPANIKVVSDAIEAAANALGLPVTGLETTAKSIVPAINELKGKVDTLEANNSLWQQKVFSQQGISVTAGQSFFEYDLPVIEGYTPQYAILKTASHMQVMWAFSVYLGKIYAQYRSTSVITTGFEVYVWYRRN